MDNKDLKISRLDAIPRLRYGCYPTPLEEMPRLREALGGGPQLFIKRDDYTGAGFGGNKVRKLEYMLARAAEDEKDVVITVGGEKSNHARVTAAMCARYGLRCILVLNRGASETVPQNLKPASLYVDEMTGAELHFVNSREARFEVAAELAAKLRGEGKHVAEIPLGASVPLGALGYVQAAREVVAQFAEIGIRPTHIFHSSSSGGTQAGLLAGCRLMGYRDTKIVGVSPDDPAESIAEVVAEIANGINELLGDSARQVDASQVTVLDDYIGRGYGLVTPESTAALKLVARTEGILLDPVYTAKVMAAMIDWIEKGKLTEADTVLFWHTGGQLALFYTPLNY